jgi:PilZ domain
MEHSRRVPRQSAGWRGLCLAEGDPANGWHECRVVDISMFGLGITLHHPAPSQLMGRPLYVEVPALDDRVKIRFEGTVRNAAAQATGGVVRVGIEFAGISEADRPMTAVVSVLSARASPTLPARSSGGSRLGAGRSRYWRTQQGR